MDATGRPAVVIDNGTGYTKMGYAGNVEPCFIVPTAVALSRSMAAGGAAALAGWSPMQFHSAGVMADLDFFIGNEALSVARTGAYLLSNPIRHGQVDNWDAMERFWQQCVFNYLRCDPEDHFFLLTESPLTPPEHREYTAEIMFETFNVAGLYIAVQAVLALTAGFTATPHAPLTGVVVDAGDGVTHVVPVVDGYVIGSAIRSIPIAGRDVTAFVQQLMRERGEPVPPEDAMEVARKVKEQHAYTCADIVKEFGKHDREPDKYRRLWSANSSKTGQAYTADVGYERFLGPEIFFSPEIYSSDFTVPLPEVVDHCIQGSPIDTRRALYKNIVLSGGSTMFKDFGRRMQRDVKKLVDSRGASSTASAASLQGATPPAESKAKAVEVAVISHHMQRFAVWFGGSVLASTPNFHAACHTKAEYEECGPSICRTNPVFKGVL